MSSLCLKNSFKAKLVKESQRGVLMFVGNAKKSPACFRLSSPQALRAYF